MVRIHPGTFYFKRYKVIDLFYFTKKFNKNQRSKRSKRELALKYARFVPINDGLTRMCYTTHVYEGMVMVIDIKLFRFLTFGINKIMWFILTIQTVRQIVSIEYKHNLNINVLNSQKCGSNQDKFIHFSISIFYIGLQKIEIMWYSLFWLPNLPGTLK